MKLVFTKPRYACVFAFALLTACGMPELPSPHKKTNDSEQNTADQGGLDKSAARINLTATRSDATSLQSIAELS